MNLEKYQQYSRIARGLERQTGIEGCKDCECFTEEIIRGDIAIQDGL